MARILVVDDERAIRRASGRILRNAGFEVDEAADGAQGLEAIRRSPPDLVLCDIRMPAMDGYELLERLRSDPATAELPVILLTGLVDRSDQRQGMDLGADDYLTKPYTTQELVSTVRARLARDEERSRRASERLDGLRKSIATAVPHELRTPLTTILLVTDSLMAKGTDVTPAEHLRLLGLLRRSTERLRHLIDNLLLYAELQLSGLAGRAPPTPVHVAELTRQIAQAKAEHAGRTADLVVTAEDVDVPLDAGDLKKIVDELVDNAFKFSTRGQTVEVRGRPGADGLWHLSVTDRGRGLSAEQLESAGLFEQFDRKFYEQQGAGLGLALARKLFRALRRHLPRGQRVGRRHDRRGGLPGLAAGRARPGRAY